MAEKAIVTSASPDLFPILETKSKICTNKSKADKIVGWLLEIMNEDENALGISAVQIGEPQRIFVTRLREEGEVRVFINPEIVARSRETAKRREGCLSLPGISVFVERPKHITIKFKEEFDGEEKTEQFSFKSARILQHEVDHLNGRLLTHIQDEQDLKVVQNAHRALAARKRRAAKRRKKQKSR